MLEPRYKCIQLHKLKHYIIGKFEEGYRMCRVVIWYAGSCYQRCIAKLARWHSKRSVDRYLSYYSF